MWRNRRCCDRQSVTTAMKRRHLTAGQHEEAQHAGHPWLQACQEDRCDQALSKEQIFDGVNVDQRLGKRLWAPRDMASIREDLPAALDFQKSQTRLQYGFSFLYCSSCKRQGDTTPEADAGIRILCS
jgi:hypothetical protein